MATSKACGIRNFVKFGEKNYLAMQRMIGTIAWALMALTLSFAVSCTDSNSILPPPNVNDALEKLDEVISRKKLIETAKDESIRQKHYRLSMTDSPEEKYEILDQLYSEFYQYDIDSAIFYARAKLGLARQLGSERIMTDAMFDLADRYSLSGMYMEVLEIMDKINPSDLDTDQRPAYFHIYSNVYEGLETTSDDISLAQEYKAEKGKYRKELCNSLGKNDISRVYVKTEIMREEGRGREIVEKLEPLMESGALTTHEKGILSYILAKAYQICGDEMQAVYYMATSARLDLETPVKEYKSLYELAGMMYKSGDIRRAYRYITRSVDDAIAANAVINIQSITSILPIISGSYNREIMKNHRLMRNSLAGISLLSIALAIAIFFTIRGNKKISQANAKLKEYVSLLQESNNIKESYIGRYLDMCSYYIGGLERYRSALRKSAKNGGFQEVNEMLKSGDFIDKELNEFYAQFDASFLNLFPDFVEQLNELLQPDKRIECKSKDGILNTELRVAALIRLGVTDSVKIAYFLRRSVSTIYNYRVKMRNSALSDREEFEKQIMHIGRFE